MKTLALALCLLSLAGCAATKGEVSSVGSSITTVTPSATPPNYGSGWDSANTEEFAFATYGTLEEYTLHLDEIFWEMDRINREISIAMLDEDWSDNGLQERMRDMEQCLLRVSDLEAPKNLAQIQGEFASASLAVAELYGTVAYLLGGELAFAKFQALQAEIESKTVYFNQVATILLQALV